MTFKKSSTFDSLTHQILILTRALTDDDFETKQKKKLDESTSWRKAKEPNGYSSLILASMKLFEF